MSKAAVWRWGEAAKTNDMIGEMIHDLPGT